MKSGTATELGAVGSGGYYGGAQEERVVREREEPHVEKERETKRDGEESG